jgi:pectate lyase C
MKKNVLIVLSILVMVALSLWFACNPFQQNEKDVSAILNELDDSSGSKLVLSCTIQVNGSTFDANGETYDATNLFNFSEALNPTFAVTNGTVKNAILIAPTVNGIFLFGGNCTVDNITASDVGEDIVTVKRPGTYIISNCTFNKSEDKIIQVNDLCTITTQNVKVDTSGRFIRQFGGKTWKMTSYSDNCTVMNMSECVFKSDSSVSTFFYRNLTTNCSTIAGYSSINGVVTITKAVPY